MAEVITVRGRVTFPITLDPSVWIFDDRKLDMSRVFADPGASPDEQPFGGQPVDQARNISLQWERELQDRAIPSRRSEMLFVEKKNISGDYGMKLGIFLKNAEPHEDAREVVFHLHDGSRITLPLTQAEEAILCFAVDGKPIRGDEGPVLLYFGDGSNRHDPVKGITSIEIR